MTAGRISSLLTAIRDSLIEGIAAIRGVRRREPAWALARVPAPNRPVGHRRARRRRR